jgi:hypothetical protein
VAVTTTSSIRFTESAVVWEFAEKNEKDNTINQKAFIPDMVIKFSY